MPTIARTDATGGDLDPAFAAWQSSLSIDRRLLPEDLEGSRAHVRALARAGLLTPDEAHTLLSGLDELARRIEAGTAALPQEEDVHMAVEALLREIAGPVADKLHTGRSRNDQVATDLALWLRGACARLGRGIDGVLRAAEVLCERHGDVPIPTYTHRQVAIGLLAHTWLEAALSLPLSRDRALLRTAVDRIDAACPLGAGAIAGTTLPIDPDATARDLGFARGPDNPVFAVSQRDDAAFVLFVCAQIAGHLARFATDVIEFVSDGLWHVGGAVACGSSMMPHKKNPDLFELVRGEAALRIGDLTALLTLTHGLATGYHRDLQHDKATIFRSVDGTCDALSMVALALPHLEPDAAACRRALEDGDALATDLTEHLVAAGVPFREAYRRVGSLVASQRRKGRRLVDLSPGELAAAGIPPGPEPLLDVAASARRRSARFHGRRQEPGGVVHRAGQGGDDVGPRAPDGRT